jgi:multisubunit Na+/H+ antiporter MnhE subunit
MKSWQRTAGLFFLLLSGLVIQQSVQVLKLFDHGQPGSGLMPFGLGVILAVLSLWLIAANRGADEQRVPFWEHRAWARPLTALAIASVYAFVFDKLGAIASVAILVACWLYLVERKRIAVALVTGALTGAVVHLLFERFLQTPFPKGILF